MADYRDESGIPARRTDEYGNPLSAAGDTGIATGGGYRTEYSTGAGTTGVHPGVTNVGIEGGQPELRRSGSSSSSSSEDDGQGGRRKKKGLKEKIKEKLPGGHKEEHRQQGEQAGYGYEQQQQEKKGIMDKIKEKLPGHHKEEGAGHDAAGGGY